MTKPSSEEIRLSRGRQLIDRLGRGKLHYIDLTWPGGKLRFRLRALTASDRQNATADAIQRCKEIGMPIEPMFAEEYSEEVVVQRLWRALEDPLAPLAGAPNGECERLFENATLLRDTFTPGERAAMFDCLVDLEEEIDPLPETMDPADVEAIMDAIKKKDPTLLRGFGSITLRNFIVTTVGPLLDSPTGKSESSDSSS